MFAKANLQPITVRVIYENQDVLDKLLAQNPEYKIVYKKLLDKDAMYIVLKYQVPEGWMMISKMVPRFNTTVPKMKEALKELGLMEKNNTPTPKSYEEDYAKAFKAEKTKYDNNPTAIYFWNVDKLSELIRVPSSFEKNVNFTCYSDFIGKLLHFLNKYRNEMNIEDFHRHRNDNLAADLICNFIETDFEEASIKGFSRESAVAVSRSKSAEVKKKHYLTKIDPVLKDLRVLLEKYLPDHLATFDKMYEQFYTYGTTSKKKTTFSRAD